jgi:hypothetical protein
MSSSQRCPTCGRPFDRAISGRFCCLCKQRILKHHKYFINAKGKLQHRFCDNPESYGFEVK